MYYEVATIFVDLGANRVKFNIGSPRLVFARALQKAAAKRGFMLRATPTKRMMAKGSWNG